MLELARKHPPENTHVVDLPYRFSSWALDEPANARLWTTSEGELLAWGILQTPFWTIDCACQPEVEGEMYAQILEWADERARNAQGTPFGQPAWFVNIFSQQEDRIKQLEKNRFADQADAGENAWSKVLLQVHLSEASLEAKAPEGFAIRPLRGASEVPEYVQLHQAVFGTRNMTESWRSRTLEQTRYAADCDLVATAPDGRLAAFCVGWLSLGMDGVACGQIEPMGVGEEYRHLGLGRAILTECLSRLRKNGASIVYVETDHYRCPALELYESTGFRPFRDILVFGKDFAA